MSCGDCAAVSNNAMHIKFMASHTCLMDFSTLLPGGEALPRVSLQELCIFKPPHLNRVVYNSERRQAHYPAFASTCTLYSCMSELVYQYDKFLKGLNHLTIETYLIGWPFVLVPCSSSQILRSKCFGLFEMEAEGFSIIFGGHSDAFRMFRASLLSILQSIYNASFSTSSWSHVCILRIIPQFELPGLFRILSLSNLDLCSKDHLV